MPRRIPFVVHGDFHALLMSVQAAGDGRGLVALQWHVRDGHALVGVAVLTCGRDSDVGGISVGGGEKEVSDGRSRLTGKGGNIRNPVIFHRVYNGEIRHADGLVLVEVEVYGVTVRREIVGAVNHQARHGALQGHCHILRRAGLDGHIHLGGKGVACLRARQPCRGGGGDGGHRVGRYAPCRVVVGEELRRVAPRRYQAQGMLAVVERQVRLGKVGRVARLVQYLEERARGLVVVENEEVGDGLAVCGHCGARDGLCLAWWGNCRYVTTEAHVRLLCGFLTGFRGGVLHVRAACRHCGHASRQQQGGKCRLMFHDDRFKLMNYVI